MTGSRPRPCGPGDEWISAGCSTSSNRLRRWTARATRRGRLDPPGLPATGKRVAFAGADFHEYHDGKVARLWTVFDARDLLVQLGVLPKSGSTAEKAVIGLHRLRFRLLRSRIDR
ncbi:ester cyclase [Rhodococcus ruber]|uniref:ester cyclase n=1 Tax=Rhodococcus ruber TaxID=1830 RepID=UPI001268301F|nr:ester cyclase [Rhodococcus ruber]